MQPDGYQGACPMVEAVVREIEAHTPEGVVAETGLVALREDAPYRLLIGTTATLSASE